MEKMEMVEKLRERFSITMEEAKEVLERNEWDLLNACIELEKSGAATVVEEAVKKEATEAKAEERKEAAKEAAAKEETSTKKTEDEQTKKEKTARRERHGKRLGEAVRNLVRLGIDNKFVVTKEEAELVKLPVIVPIVCFVANFWLSLIVAFAGLAFGFKYSFEGKELGKEVFNNTMEKASEAANGIVNNLADKKETVAETVEEAVVEETVAE